ncbi:MAG: hypothetical protein HN719_02785 [Alphaproteobacteria bacterium]|jgi:hypothetical protein|nr:hypothetical protein [Alphaproteobacteria bacterium]
MKPLIGFVITLVLALPALGQKTPPPPRSLSGTSDLGRIIFKEVEKRVIEEFFGKQAAKASTSGDDDKDGEKKKKKSKKNKGQGRGKGLPPGLAKRGSLPPGLKKQLEKNGTLPPGLATSELPAELESKLPPVPSDLERIIAGDNVVLMEKATGKILDIIQGVIKGK